MKNPNGLGTVIKLSGKRRKPFAVRITDSYDMDGKQKRKYIGYYATKKEAIEALAVYYKNFGVINAGQITIAKLFELWSDIKFEKVSHTMANSYKSAYEWIKDVHNAPISEVKPAVIESIIKACPRAYATKKNILVLFRQLFEYAIVNELWDRDYTQYIKLEQTESLPDRPIFTASEISLLEEAVQNGVAYADVILIAIFTGLRPAELLGLEKQNIHLEDQYLQVTKSKTNSGLRPVPIADRILPLVEKRYNRSLKYFVEKDGKAITYDHYFRQIFRPLMEHLGLNPKHRPHDTRHTFATMLSNADANPVSIRKLCGHSSYTVTAKHYTHKSIAELKKAVDLI